MHHHTPEPEPEQRYWYRCAGLTIVSALPLDGLVPPAAPARPDVRIELAAPGRVDQFADQTVHVLTVGEQGAPWLEVRRGPTGYLARWPHQLDVIVPDDGTRILVHQRGEVADSIPRLLLCPALSFVLPAHGREALHASAVEIDGRAVVIAGKSGHGKSTLAAALSRAGGRLLADDVASVRLSPDGTPLVDPASQRVWLMREVAMLMHGVEGRSDGRLHKVSVGGDGIEPALDSVPLGAIYLLAFRNGEPQVSAPLSQRDAMLAFISNLFNYVIRTPERMTMQFAVATEIAVRAPIRRISWEPGPERAPQLAERIIAELSARPGPGSRESAASANGNGSSANGGGSDGNGRANGTGGGVGSDRRRLLELLRGAGVADAEEDPRFDEPLLRTAQVAALLRSSDRTVRLWADAGKLPYIRTLGGRRLFPASGVMAVLQSMRANGEGNR